MVGATVFSLLITSWVAAASGATTPVQGTRDLVAAITAKEAAQAGAIRRVKDYFDYDHLVAVPIEPHKEKLNNEQLAKYSEIFRELLENAPFIASLGDGQELEYTISDPVTKNDQVKVALQAYNAETDVDTAVEFVWRKQDDTWRVVDVSLDGASMLKGYQNQFGRILKKEGADGLLTRIADRLAKVKSQRKSTGT